jgi:hypothetical protein
VVFDDGVELHFEEEGVELHSALPAPLEAWRRRSIAGMLMTGIALGLREALEPKREQAAIVADAPGDPPGSQAVEVNVDADRPAESVLVLRPWLLRQGDQ